MGHFRNKEKSNIIASSIKGKERKIGYQKIVSHFVATVSSFRKYIEHFVE